MERVVCSIILIAYNSSSYIGRAIESVLNQDEKNVEVICVVDPSTDGTAEVVKQYSAKDDRVILYEAPARLGVGGSRRKGLELARGDYFTILDADDYLKSDFVSKMVEEMEKEEADIGCCSFYHHNGDKNKKDIWCKKAIYNHDKAIKALFGDAFIRGYLWGKMYKREKLLSGTNLIVSVPLDMQFEDLALNLSLFEKADKVISIKDPLLYYEEGNQGSAMHQGKPVRAQRHLFIWNLCRYYMEKIKDEEGVRSWYKRNFRFLLSLNYDLSLDKKHGASKDYLSEIKQSFKRSKKNKEPMINWWDRAHIDMAESAIAECIETKIQNDN